MYTVHIVRWLRSVSVYVCVQLGVHDRRTYSVAFWKPCTFLHARGPRRTSMRARAYTCFLSSRGPFFLLPRAPTRKAARENQRAIADSPPASALSGPPPPAWPRAASSLYLSRRCPPPTLSFASHKSSPRSRNADRENRENPTPPSTTHPINLVLVLLRIMNTGP